MISQSSNFVVGEKIRGGNRRLLPMPIARNWRWGKKAWGVPFGHLQRGGGKMEDINPPNKNRSLEILQSRRDGSGEGVERGGLRETLSGQQKARVSGSPTKEEISLRGGTSPDFIFKSRKDRRGEGGLANASRQPSGKGAQTDKAEAGGCGRSRKRLFSNTYQKAKGSRFRPREGKEHQHPKHNQKTPKKPPTTQNKTKKSNHQQKKKKHTHKTQKTKTPNKTTSPPKPQNQNKQTLNPHRTKKKKKKEKGTSGGTRESGSKSVSVPPRSQPLAVERQKKENRRKELGKGKGEDFTSRSLSQKKVEMWASPYLPEEGLKGQLV